MPRRVARQGDTALGKREPLHQGGAGVPYELVGLSGLFFDNFDSIPQNYYYDDSLGYLGRIYLLTWGANAGIFSDFPTGEPFPDVQWLYTAPGAGRNVPNYDDPTGTCLLDKIRGLINGVAKKAPVTIVQLDPTKPDWGLLVGLQTVLSDVRTGRNTPRGTPLTVIIPFNVDDSSWTKEARQYFRNDITDLLVDIQIWGGTSIVPDGYVTNDLGSESDGFPLGVPAALAGTIESLIVVGGVTQNWDYAHHYQNSALEFIDVWAPSEGLTCVSVAGVDTQVTGTSYGRFGHLSPLVASFSNNFGEAKSDLCCRSRNGRRSCALLPRSPQGTQRNSRATLPRHSISSSTIFEKSCVLSRQSSRRVRAAQSSLEWNLE